ncbi:bifunctional isocitrate dehydrogenase kinase/phosphatase [Algivirga pacifica]|uniref:Bifunctional isocitrate dehydrogenase kinase/phosphatase n=1 Tax=Algivirga pacifica TaxID=1162670 RepID=A0ABP9DG93_9BACT
MDTQVSRCIFKGFLSYFDTFMKVTSDAKERFEQVDWTGAQKAHKMRLLIRKQKMREVTEKVRLLMGNHIDDLEIWRQIKVNYALLVSDYENDDIAETFYNSIFSRLFSHQFIDPCLMFVYSSQENNFIYSQEPIYHIFWVKEEVSTTVREILLQYPFQTPYQNFEEDVRLLTTTIKEHLLPRLKTLPRIEVCKEVFYRNKGAYLVGRAISGEKVLPFVIPILNEPEKGLYVDTLLIEPNDVSILFSFTRSYFMVYTKVPSILVRFLSSILKGKELSEIYNSIGFNKHGKTVFYREFLTQLNVSYDQFVIAPGIKGMVMSVFTLPSFNFVFKIIKDRFDPPKEMSRERVKQQYKLVSRHDRVGRMADTHEFHNFRFPKDRFSQELLEELQTVAPSIIEVSEEEIIIKHLYTERRMIPLNIYLEHANENQAEEAIGEYGNAIKQLAAANIFPGDMLLKNFGVTRHRRVVFYDYDEICFLTECNFRPLPFARNDEEEYVTEYSVGPNDIFPEEFKRFLIGKPHIREIFFRLHDDIFTVKFWKNLQRELDNGKVMDVFPYRKKKRFMRSNQEQLSHQATKK